MGRRIFSLGRRGRGLTEGKEVGFGEGLITVLAGDIVVEVEIRETRFEGFHLDGTR